MRAGIAKTDITCREEGAAAFSASDKTMAHIPRQFWDKKVQIDDPLFLKVLILDDGSSRFALITMDTTAIGARTITQGILVDNADDFLPNLRARLKNDFGILPECVAVCASHTHPPGRLLCSDTEQIDKAALAVGEALAHMAPVRVGAASVNQEGLTFNRTLRMKDGSDYTLRGSTPLPPDDAVESLRPVDPEVTVLRVDRLDGTPLAVVYNFGCHLLVGQPSGNVTADFPGVSSSHVETVVGNSAMAFFIQGAGGDVSEIQRFDKEHPKWGPEFGVQLGESVLEAFRKAQPCEARLALASTVTSFPLRKDIPGVIAALQKEQSELTSSLRYTSLNFKTFLPLYLKYALHPEYPLNPAHRYLRARESGDPGFETLDSQNRLEIEKYLQSLATMEKLAVNEEKIATLRRHQEIIEELGTSCVDVEIQGIRIGDSVIITAPIEVLSETGLKVKAASPFRHTIVASDTNGYLHYAPPASYYPRGGYEVTECLLAPDWEPRFDRAVSEILKQLESLKPAWPD